MEFVLGTFCRIDLYGSENSQLYDRLFSRLAELERILSANRADSELSALNSTAALRAISVSPELRTVLERALFFAEASGGAFDPTVGPLVQLWGIGEKTPRIPSADEIQAALDMINWRDLELQADGGVFLRRPGMAVDVGAIAKGYAADELVKILREKKVPQALIDLGGNIYVWGAKKDNTPWRIGIQNPLDERGSYVGIVETQSISMVTSGVYERFFIGEDAVRYHHIFALSGTGTDKPGYPVNNGLLSVTVAAPSSMDADALSTTCFALGYEKGCALAEAAGVKAIFIFADKTIRGSAGALDTFTLIDTSFRIE
ncbi:MAG: FAD:protein FMN transferase [Spirochaetaceae bacterium]|jgi:thiamine biosynthesis lipoprotein|nr:FAD:protein FMN transferase [Spirochaetaceae bacterium]